MTGMTGMSAKRVRVLLLWPGADAGAGGNFGVPQLVLLGTYAQQQTGAKIDIRDLEFERAHGPISLPKLLAADDGEGYDVIALSVYSSFDHLKCTAIAEIARSLWPDAVLIVGGYHPSARPYDYVRDGSPFDVCVIGEGERALVRVIESVQGGAPLRGPITLGPDAIDDLDSLPPSDWSLLERYREAAPRMATQAQVYLSRGCPFDCAFCMERAKREVSWRPLSVERALGEIASLHRFLDLRGWTLYFGDALFGMRKSWRREFLEGLTKLDIPVDKYWLLIRVDLIDDEDLRLFAAANCGLGFGLESGDPDQLAIIRKSGRLDTYLDRMEHIAERAREVQVPWGANIICGHPGETRASMQRSAAYLRKLFLRERGTTGFLSVDPFRLYPGSPIDAERSAWEQKYGTRFHRPHWWEDGDPEFLAEWIDPSAELTYLEREALQHELIDPILAQIEGKFAYRGRARDYFLSAIRDQVEFNRPSMRLHFLGRYFAWQGYLGRRTQAERERREHLDLRAIARSERERRLDAVAVQAEVPRDHPIMAALLEVPRERFVPTDEVAQSVRDVAIALGPTDADGSELATVSAMHAYARSFSLLEVGSGDRVLDLGAGTGYGAALLTSLVGERGSVVAVEIDPTLVELGRREAGEVEWHCADALAAETWEFDARAIAKVTVGFALDDLPDSWLAAFAEGTRIIAPLRESAGELRLSRIIHAGDRFVVERLEPVHYVGARRAAAPAILARREPVKELRLPVLR
ncbi:radical SAM protein [Nannocystaceae bacterium ST9]